MERKIKSHEEYFLDKNNMERDLEYERNNIITVLGREEIKCRNYELCGESTNREYLHLYEWGKFYLCTFCHIKFNTWGSATQVLHEGRGVLNFRDNVECPICLETKRGITQPRCSHWACIDCFKRCYYGEDGNEEPVFPYPEIKDEYFDDVDNDVWEQQYPLIKTYVEQWELYEETVETRLEQEGHLQLCPLCRK